MTFIFDLPDEELLPVTYDLVEEIENFCQTTGLLDIRKNRDEGLDIHQQGKANLKKMFYRVCKEYPKESSRVLSHLWKLEDGEKAPNALVTFAKVVVRKDAMDFFTSALSLAQ